MIGDNRDEPGLSQPLLQPDQFVYFIGCGCAGPVKVGRTTNIHKRMRDLQIANHAELRLLFLYPTPESERVEAHVHEALRKHWVRGEWFRRSAKMTNLIDLMRRGLFQLPEKPLISSDTFAAYARAL